jgi:NADH-quinone oxidoreductase subunit H
MRFALFFLAEYAHIITGSAIFVLLFLGGWEPLPFVTIFGGDAVHIGGGLMDFLLAVLVVKLKLAVLFGKAVTLVAFMMLIRWTIPRFRYDQIMMGAWQAIIPLALTVVVVTAAMVQWGRTDTLSLVIANGAVFALLMLVLPLLPKYDPNRKIPLYGSRFNPMPGERVVTGPTVALAREDHPVRGTL